jgi:hypothetical protein
MPKYLGDVRCWVNSGKHVLASSISEFDPTRTFGLKEYASISGPEPVLPLLIALILPELGRLSVFHPPDVDLRKRRSEMAAFGGKRKTCAHSFSIFDTRS